MTTPNRPPGRYDEPRALPRPVLIAVFAVLLIALTAGAWWAFDRSRQGQVEFGVTGYHVVSDSRVTVTFEVHKPDGRTALCRVEAQGRFASLVGSADVVVGLGSPVTVSRDVVTTSRAATVVVTGCRLEPLG